MKVPVAQRQRVHFKSFHRQWRRAIADVDRYFVRIEQKTRHGVLAELAAREAKGAGGFYLGPSISVLCDGPGPETMIPMQDKST